MSTSRILRAIAITKPCSEKWEEMAGNEQARFCSHCELNVNDLSQMTRAKAVKLVRKSKGRICLRIHRDPLGQLMTRESVRPLYTISRRASRFAAGAFTAVMSLSAAAYAQSTGNGGKGADEAVAEKPVKHRAAGTFSYLFGTVTDMNGGVIPEVPVTIVNEQNGETYRTTTAADGTYREWLSGDYSYRLKIESYGGFSSFQSPSIELRRAADTRWDVTLSAAGLTGMVVTVRQYQQPLVELVSRSDDWDDIEPLLRKNGNINQAEDDGTTALDVAVADGNTEIAGHLINAGAKVNLLDEAGNNVLFHLTDDSEPELIELLLKAGANIDQINAEGASPLLHAAEVDNVDLVKALIARGAKVDLQDHAGNTALILAAKEGNDECVEELLAAGANFRLRNQDEADAIQLAVEHNNDDVADRLEAAGAIRPVDPPASADKQ